MANVNFKKGLAANLPSAKAEGTFYVTTDERALYLDVDSSTRVRIGDFQEFATLAALQGNINPSTTALYYVTALNCLAKWNGTSYVQINLDTGATSIVVTGSGNAVTSATYDATTRKLTLTKGTTFATPTDITNKVGIITGTVKEYVDNKTSGIASDTALATLTTRVTTAESDIDALEAKVGTKTVSAQITTAITALDLANTYEAKGAANSKDAAIAAAKKAGTDAQSDVDALETLVGKLPSTGTTATTVVGYVDEKTAAAVASATYNDAPLKSRVTASETSIATLNGTGTGSVKKQVSDAVASIVAAAPAAYDTLKEISDWITTHAGSASAMNTQITTNKSDITKLESLIGTLPSGAASTTIVDYIKEALAGSGAASAVDLAAAVARIGKNETAIAALQTKMTAAEGKLTTLNGAKTVTGSVAKGDADTLAAAKVYADTLVLAWSSF